MIDNFAQILRRMPTTADAPSTSNRFGGVTPFKVQVNFEIPSFEGNTYAFALGKWSSLLEGYFSIKKKIDSENITFSLFKCLPHIKD